MPNDNFLLQACFIALGLLLFLNAVIATVASNFTAGVFATYFIGACFIAYGILLKSVLKLPPFVNGLMLLLVLSGFSFTAALLIYGGNDSVTYKENAVIVLGAGIRGEKVGNSLKQRLDSAIEYNQKNPHALIVVSGGQGKYEDISEALAMERYLVSNGVPKESIVKEDRSTSTAENFEFSKALLDEHFDGEYSVAFISNSFHIYRATATARDKGFDNVTHVGADTSWYLVLPSTFRECMAVIRIWII